MLEIVEDGLNLPVPPPQIQPEMSVFWEALRVGELLLPHCRRCEFVVWSPRPYCPKCGSFDVDWVSASGDGVVYSFTVNRRGKGFNKKYQEIGPYIVAYVELAEGPRILTNIVDADVDSVEIGVRVRGVVHRAGDDVIVRFRPVEGESAHVDSSGGAP
ncbi:hypothetical protein GCM10025768_02910 [Microbacterium pseudoresistens]|uniref:Zn-ribbon domain-containing OB-fold protein n=1 Tax=Microbacterium pseudoresistens TaxID=640634 RepID=A0A7Y9JLV7_9MICO|nr:OB-fold domain-containing protein [Microbacterium pseudoresistens]NYD54127.1 hypothetical protein [Microbacterium pseudoresistens]